MEAMAALEVCKGEDFGFLEMKKNRRSFLKVAALGGVSLAGAGIMKGFACRSG